MLRFRTVRGERGLVNCFDSANMKKVININGNSNGKDTKNWTEVHLINKNVLGFLWLFPVSSTTNNFLK